MSGGLLEDLNFDRANEDSMELVGKIQLKNYGQFLERFNETFSATEKNLNDNAMPKSSSMMPRVLEMTPYENISLIDLVSSENRLFRKVVLALTSLCNEMQLLKDEGRELLNTFIFYGEAKTSHEDSLRNGEAQLQIGRMLSAFQQLSAFVNRSAEVIRAVVQQLSGIHGGLRNSPSANKTPFIDAHDLHLLTVFEYLFDLLSILISFDCVLSSHVVLEEQWQSYRRTLASAMQNPGKVGVEVDKLRPFDRYLMRLKGQLLDGIILMGCIEQQYENSDVFVNKNQKFAQELKLIIRKMGEQLIDKIGEPNETDQREKFIGLCGLIVLDFHLFRSSDKKLMKFIWTVNKKLPIICVGGMYSFSPSKFLSSKIQGLNKLLSNSELQGANDSAVVAWLSNKETNLEKTIAYCETQTLGWLVQSAREFDTYAMERRKQVKATRFQLLINLILCNFLGCC